MKKRTTILATLFVSTAIAAAPALAADGGVARGTKKNVESGATTMDNGTTAMGAGSSTANGNTTERGTKKENSVGTGSAMADMQNLKTADVSTVKVVRAGDMATTDRSTDQPTATNTTPEEQASIQSALESNPKVMEQLKSQSVDVSQVVAANYDGNGTLTVYTR